ncbi:unnamed protein product, partial [Mesorhabditis belari]|uniref:Uncharacterized protein n=1 Tax=Mesorhabditis belari TaxID=2138241 RepID=A0AAF3JAG3_9BILA
MVEDKENIAFTHGGDETSDHPMSHMEPKDVFVMALRKSANKEEMANWTDVRAHYKKFTGRHLNQDELGRIAENLDKTRRELFNDELSAYLTPIDSQGNIVRVHFKKGLTPIGLDGGKIGHLNAAPAENKAMSLGPSGDDSGYKMDVVPPAPKPIVEEPAAKKMLLLRKEKQPEPLPKQNVEEAPQRYGYQMDFGRSLPAVLAPQKAFHEQIEKELTQGLKHEGIDTQSNKSAVEPGTHQPQRVPTWEKGFATVESNASSHGKTVREIAAFLEECRNNEPNHGEHGEKNVLALGEEVPQEDLVIAGITNAPEITKESSSKKKKDHNRHLMRQRQRLTCCSIL